MNYEDKRMRVLEKLEAGDPHGAFGELRWHLAYPTVPGPDTWQDAFELFARIAREIAGEEFAQLISAISRDRYDVQALYDAAYALYENGVFDVAATLLSRANEEAPGTAAIVVEFSAALESALLYRQATEMLQKSGLVGQDAWCTYLLAYNLLMSGSLEAAHDVLASVPAQPEGDLQIAVQRVAGMLTRAEALEGASPLDEQDLDGWHAVINGGVLLHEAVDGFSEAMRGRYAYVGDDYGMLRAGLESASSVLAAAGIEVPRIIAAPDRSSQILAWAMANSIDAPLEQFVDASERPGLLVVYDLQEVGDPTVLENMEQHRPGQVLWSHASCWTEPFPYTPDLTTYLYQHSTSPWGGGGMRLDPETNRVVSTEPDDSPVEEIGARILDAEPVESHASPDQLLRIVGALAAVRGEAAAGLFRSSGVRTRQQAGSPVPSNRFQ